MVGLLHSQIRCCCYLLFHLLVPPQTYEVEFLEANLGHDSVGATRPKGENSEARVLSRFLFVKGSSILSGTAWNSSSLATSHLMPDNDDGLQFQSLNEIDVVAGPFAQVEVALVQNALNPASQ
jgi:hypothetical protein